MIQPESPRSLRRAYLDWIEEQLEEYKDSVPRSELLRIADEVVHALRIDPRGQYQFTEILLSAAVDRHLVRMLKLPGYRSWRAARRAEVAPDAPAPVAPPSEKPDSVPLPARVG